MEQIENPEKLQLNNFKDNLLGLLVQMKATAETQKLKEKLQKCDNPAELLEIVTEMSNNAYTYTSKKKYLTQNDADNYRAIIRNLNDTGMKLKEVLKKKSVQ
jgi:hypothetical protein